MFALRAFYLPGILSKIVGVSIVATTLLLCGCNKDTFKTVKVTYRVRCAIANKVNIQCYNDYYFDSGSLKTIEFTSEGYSFRSSRFVNTEEPYYIKVDYLDSTQNIEANYLVEVLFDDTMVVAQKKYLFAQPLVELSGTVTEQK
ncbi:MAG: hypothetical protein IPO27_11350 [Bacteroidetes bacterium]|nr:hypothetical protein [Bacteroidota bacterium]